MDDSTKLNAEAIIVVGPILWKCINCDLLLSRQHSIDEHLVSHHKNSFNLDRNNRLCKIALCACHKLAKQKDSSQRHFKFKSQNRQKFKPKHKLLSQISETKSVENSNLVSLDSDKSPACIIPTTTTTNLNNTNTSNTIPEDLYTHNDNLSEMGKENSCSVGMDLLPSGKTSTDTGTCTSHSDSTTGSRLSKTLDPTGTVDQNKVNASNILESGCNLTESKREIYPHSLGKDNIKMECSVDELRTKVIVNEKDSSENSEVIMPIKSKLDTDSKGLKRPASEEEDDGLVRRKSRRSNKGKNSLYQEFQM